MQLTDNVSKILANMVLVLYAKRRKAVTAVCYHLLQGGEGDCFYVVGSGEFEVFATQVSFSVATISIFFFVFFFFFFFFFRYSFVDWI